MKYYAVTEDPNELMHYGILGMKWGIRHDKPRHTGSGRRSHAYKKAQSKLGKMMKSGIKKAEASWKAYNSPAAKEARFMDKAMQKARTGTLKYGKLTDDQVRRVTERLALERNARMLGSTENPSFAKRIKTSIGEGVVKGVGLGTASYIDRRMAGRGETTAKIKADKRMAKYESSRAGRRAERRKAKAAINEEYYRTAYEEGDSSIHALGARNRAKYLSEVKSRNKEKDYNENIQRIYDEQASRSRAVSDSQRNDWRRNALLNDINSGTRKLGGAKDKTYYVYDDREKGEGKKVLKTGSALDRLNAWNEYHEKMNTHGNNYYDSMNTSLAVINARENREREKARADRAFNETMRSKQRADAARETARIQVERERQERLNNMQNERRLKDERVTSNRRKRARGR